MFQAVMGLQETNSSTYFTKHYYTDKFNYNKMQFPRE